MFDGAYELINNNNILHLVRHLLGGFAARIRGGETGVRRGRVRD